MQAPAEVLRVLVVDDEPSLLSLLVELLTDSGCEAIGVSSAGEALAEVRRGVFDVVLTDVALPDMRGDVLGHALLQAQSRLRLIYMTGHGAGSQAVPGWTGPPGAVWLAKPLSWRDLTEALDAVRPSAQQAWLS